MPYNQLFQTHALPDLSAFGLGGKQKQNQIKL